MNDLQHEMTVSAPAAGWYPDPADPGSSRWWSGVAWTDHTQPAAVAAVPATAPVLSVAPVSAPIAPAPITPSPVNLDADGVPLTLFADSVFTPTVLTAPAKPSTQSDWHAQSGHDVAPRRQAAGSVSQSTSVPTAASRKHDPYRERNGIAGVAFVLSLLSIPALAARVLVDLPTLSQSIFLGAPIAISLLALGLSVRRGTGLVLSIIAVGVSGLVLAAALLVDPAVIRSMVEPIVALLPAG